MGSFENLDLVTSVELRNTGTEEKPVYHFIYASQLYGTIFGIYARFDGTEINSGAAYQVEKISMKLLNYKGVVNIGFTDDSIDWNQVDDVSGSLDFHVAGMSAKGNKNFIFIKPFVVKKNVRFGLSFNRILHPLSGFERKRTPIDASGRLSEEPPVSPYFDSEFNERDGIDFYNRDIREGMHGYNPPTGHGKQVWVASPRCIQSFVNLIY